VKASTEKYSLVKAESNEKLIVMKVMAINSIHPAVASAA